MAAVKKATGEYCIFVDSDDLLVENALETINYSLKKYQSPDLLVYSFFYENENAAPYYFSLGGLDDIKIYVKDSVITAKMKKRMPEISTFYGGNIITQEDLLATGEMTALAAVYRKFPSNSKTTFNGNTSPVYFVDGVETMDVSGIPVMEVAYIEYVKPTNPACASLGMRGANGIILFTTKTKYESSLSKEYFQPEREINIIRKFDAASELKKYSTITK
jgi:hypothetical protein